MLYVTENGNVGIGTAAPGANFEIHADAGSNTNFYLSDDDVAHGMTAYAPTNVFGTIGANNGTAGGLNITGYSDDSNSYTSGLVFRGYMQTSTTLAPAVDIRTGRRNGSGPDNLYLIQTAFQIGNYDGTTAYFSILGSGNVGIGDTDPDANLEVVDDFMVSSAAANDGDLFIVKNSGFVGIGTTTPTVSFQVATSTASATTTVEFGKANQGSGAGFCLKTYNSAGVLTYCKIDGTALTCSTTSCE